MKLTRYYKLRTNLETFNFEKSFFNLSKTLYYFSFLGNIFLILFSFFFIKDVTNSVPTLFPGQGIFFSIFIILFMTGYELFKRFSFEQLTTTILRVKKITPTIVLSAIVCTTLIAGSFYLSLNGAHRLIDTTESVAVKLDTIQEGSIDEIKTAYAQRIKRKEEQIIAIQENDEDGVLNNRQQVVVSKLEEDIKEYELQRDAKISQLEQKTENKAVKHKSKVSENSLAFSMMVFFLEFVILIGVGFTAYYEWNAFTEMKNLLNTPKFRQLEVNLQLLKLFYQNGRKKEHQPVLSKSKMISLVRASKLAINQSEIGDFLTLCAELEITIGDKKKKVYGMSYDRALNILEKQET